MRMNANRRMNKFVLVGDFDRTIQRSRPVTSSDGKNIHDPSFASTCNHFLAIWIEAGPVKMAVGINEHGRVSRLTQNCQQLALTIVSSTRRISYANSKSGPGSNSRV